jgi:hypothetical protein
MREHILGAGRVLLAFLEEHRGEQSEPRPKVRGQASS